MITSKLATTITLMAPLALLGCSQDRPARSASGYEPGMRPAAYVAAPSAPSELGNEPSERLSDPQIASILRALNVAEVDQARIAVGRIHDDGVKHFAETMIAQHGQAVKDVDVLIQRMGYEPNDSRLSHELGLRATQIENRLSAITDSTFDRYYMESQVDMHRLALDTIDTRLTPAASSDDMKQLIARMRPSVADHLQMAQTILHSIP